MRENTDCFLAYGGESAARRLVAQLGRENAVGRIRLLCPAGREERVEGAAAMGVGGLLSAETLRAVAESAEAPYTLLGFRPTPLALGSYAVERLAPQCREPPWSMPTSSPRREGPLPGTP